jgi:hypothetical protein
MALFSFELRNLRKSTAQTLSICFVDSMSVTDKMVGFCDIAPYPRCGLEALAPVSLPDHRSPSEVAASSRRWQT